MKLIKYVYKFDFIKITPNIYVLKLNTKIRYGLWAMIEIALQEENKGIFQKDIAKNQEISEKYLDHIIASLKASGLIKNVCGKKAVINSLNPNQILPYTTYINLLNQIWISFGVSTNHHYVPDPKCVWQINIGVS